MRTLTLILTVCILSILRANAQEIPENAAFQMDQFIQSKTSVEKTRIDSDTLEKIFDASFYEVTPVHHQGNGSVSCGGYIVVMKDGELHELETLDENKPLPFLFSLLKKGVTIKNEREARCFESALDCICPVFWEEEKEHRKIDEKWIFVRSESFGYKEGFVVTLDQNSAIVQIEYNLEAIIEEDE